eukprot:jgi/Botrbrau1/7179/Bobra.0300s0009.1
MAPDLQAPPRVSLREVSEVVCPATQAGRRILKPGDNHISFMACPLQAGLYALKAARVRVGGLSLRVPAVPMGLKGPSLEQQASSVMASQISRHGSGPTGDAVPLLASTWRSSETTGQESEAVLLRVKDCQPRLTITAAAVGGALIAGHAQWLGVVLRPQHDALTEAVLHISAAGMDVCAAPGAPGLSFFGIEADTPTWASWKRSRMAGAPAGPSVPLEVGPGHPVELLPAASGVGAPDVEAGRGESGSVGKSLEGHGDDWCVVELPSGSQQLPPWTAATPSVVWLWVSAGELARQAEMVHMDDVRLARAPSVGVRQGQPEPEGTAGTAMGTGSLHPGTSRPSGHADLDVSLEYVAGCRRCHTSRLTLPVLPPFRVGVVAREVGPRRLAVQVHITSNLAWPVTVSRCEVEPQTGFAVEEEASLPNLLPLQIGAGGAGSVLMFMAVTKTAISPGRPGRIPYSTVHLEYRLRDRGPPVLLVDEVGPSRFPMGSLRPDQATRESSLLRLPASASPLGAKGPTAVVDTPASVLPKLAIKTVQQGIQEGVMHVFRHDFKLELGPEDHTPALPHLHASAGPLCCKGGGAAAAVLAAAEE